MLQIYPNLMEDNKPKPNLAGIAAIITAVTGLVGAFAVFYPKSGESEPKAKENTEQVSSLEKADDFCSVITTCIKDADHNFDNIRETRPEEFENEGWQQKEFVSKVKVPQSKSNVVNHIYLKGANGGLTYDFTSEITSGVKLIDAEAAFDQTMKKLDECLSGYTITNNADLDEETTRSTLYQLDGREITLRLIKEEQTYSVELMIEKP